MMFDWLVIGQVVPANPRRQTVRGHRECLCCRTEPCPITRIQIRGATQPHPGHGEVKMLGFPVKFADAPCRLRRPAPEIGDDTDAVLQGLGDSDG
jgi:hypothetical protein